MKRLLFGLLLLASPAFAQTSFNGVVEKVTTPTLCPGLQYQVAGTNTFLRSTTVDLSALADDVTRITGTANAPSVVCPNWVVDVTSVAPATSSLEICGTARAGCPITFRMGPPTISFNSVYYSVSGSTFVPLGDPLGVVFLSPPWLLAGTTTSGNDLELLIPPSAPVGLNIQFQGHHLDVGPIIGPGSLTNPLLITLQPTGPLCVDPGSCW